MNALIRLFEQRVRGIRLIELIGILLALGMIFWVCLSKAREGEDIRRMSQLDAQIAAEKEAVQSLKIKVAQLERPARLEALAKQYLGMQPVSAAHEASLDSLGEISHATSKPIVTPGEGGAAASVAPAAVDETPDPEAGMIKTVAPAAVAAPTKRGGH